MVLVASAVHGEGASSVAEQLASTLVKGQEGRILLVDANLRSPSQHTKLHVEPSPGLVDVAIGTPQVDSALRSELAGGFTLLPAGQPTGDPIDLLSETVLAQVFLELRQGFDWIVVDGPPVTIYSEASTLSSLADATILVLQAETTRREVAERAERIFNESGGRLVGAILNRRKYHIPDFLYRHL